MTEDELAARRRRADVPAAASLIGERVEAASSEVSEDGIVSMTLRFATGTLTVRGLPDENAHGRPAGTITVDWSAD